MINQLVECQQIECVSYFKNQPDPVSLKWLLTFWFLSCSLNHVLYCEVNRSVALLCIYDIWIIRTLLFFVIFCQQLNLLPCCRCRGLVQPEQWLCDLFLIHCSNVPLFFPPFLPRSCSSSLQHIELNWRFFIVPSLPYRPIFSKIQFPNYPRCRSFASGAAAWWEEAALKKAFMCNAVRVHLFSRTQEKRTRSVRAGSEPSVCSWLFSDTEVEALCLWSVSGKIMKKPPEKPHVRANKQADCDHKASLSFF